MAIHGGYMEDGRSFFFPIFWVLKNFSEIWPQNSKISRIYTWKKKIENFLNFFIEKWRNFAPKKNTVWAPQELGRWAQVSMKVNGETLEKLG